MILIAAGVGALVVLGGGGTAAMLMLGHKPDPAAVAKAEKAKKKPADAKGGKDAKDSPITEGPDGVFFYAMADQTANIQTADGRPTFLKLKLAFEAPDRDTADAITPNAPRLNDMFQTFLRELRPEDLSGSQGTYQLRMELAATGEPGDRAGQDQRRADPGNADPMIAAFAQDFPVQCPNRCFETDPLSDVTNQIDDDAAPQPPQAATEVAARWEDDWVASPDEQSASGSGERILNQDEIDSLLGFDLSDDDTATTPASAPSSIRRWSPTNACRCWRSCSTAWCG